MKDMVEEKTKPEREGNAFWAERKRRRTGPCILGVFVYVYEILSQSGISARIY